VKAIDEMEKRLIGRMPKPKDFENRDRERRRWRLNRKRLESETAMTQTVLYECTQVPNTQDNIVLCDYLYIIILNVYTYILLRDRVSGWPQAHYCRLQTANCRQLSSTETPTNVKHLNTIVIIIVYRLP